MNEKNAATQGRVQWEYRQLDTSALNSRVIDERLATIGLEGWEAYAVLLDNNGERVHFFKRPIAIDPPPDGGRTARPAPIDPPPDGG